MNGYWERGGSPREVVPGEAALSVAGGPVPGYGCPGMGPAAKRLVALELARLDASVSTLNSVHSGLVGSSVGPLGSEELKQRWLPAMARCEKRHHTGMEAVYTYESTTVQSLIVGRAVSGMSVFDVLAATSSRGGERMAAVGRTPAGKAFRRVGVPPAGACR